MTRNFFSRLIVVSISLAMGIDILSGKEPPRYYRAKRSTTVELDLNSGRTRTLFEHKDNTPVVLDCREGVLLAVEFGGPKRSRMVGLSVETGKLLWELPSDNATWTHFFKRQFFGNDEADFSMPHWNLSKPPAGGGTPFCGLAGDQLAGIDVQTGRVLWKIPPPLPHASDLNAWHCIYGLRDYVVAAIGGRVMIVNRADGRISLDLVPASLDSFYEIKQPIETDEYVFMVFDQGKGKEELISWNKSSGKVDQRVKPNIVATRIMAATDKIVITHGIVARDINDLGKVLWQPKNRQWHDPGANAVVWAGHLITRSEYLPAVDLRDGSSFSLFQKPKQGPIHFPDYPLAVHDNKLYTVSSLGIMAWNKTYLQSKGSAELGQVIWSPSSETANSKRAPTFIDCFMGDGKAYLVLVHQWDPVF